MSIEYTYARTSTLLAADVFETTSAEFITLRILVCVKAGYGVDNVADPSKSVFDEIYLHKCSLTSDYALTLYGQKETLA